MAGSKESLVEGLRRRLADERASVPAFSISVIGNCRSAVLEIANGFFIVNVEQGENVRSLRLNLNEHGFNTVQKLTNYLMAQKGYNIVLASTYSCDHPSIDLSVEGMPVISARATATAADGSTQQGYTIKHRIFGDDELARYIDDAIQLHNVNYTAFSVPVSEHIYVLMKAQAQAYRVLAADTVRRKGLAEDSDALLRLAQDLDRNYEVERKRNSRVVPVPKSDEGQIGPGDVINGKLFRRSLRAGYDASYRSSVPPTSPEIFQSADDDIGDTTVRLRWSQNRETTFAYYELWRDTQPSVDRCLSGRLSAQNYQQGVPALPMSTPFSKATTSKQVLGVSTRMNQVAPTFDGFFFWTAAEVAGSNIVNATFTDGIIFPNPGAGNYSAVGEPLEPDQDYYYRLYAVNYNGEIVPSNVLHVRTRTMRARLKRGATSANLASDAISPLSGPLAGGTSVTILGTKFKTGCRVTIGGKSCTIVSLTETMMVVQTPAWENVDFIGKPMDLVITSPNGLYDIATRGWVYT